MICLNNPMCKPGKCVKRMCVNRLKPFAGIAGTGRSRRTIYERQAHVCHGLQHQIRHNLNRVYEGETESHVPHEIYHTLYALRRRQQNLERIRCRHHPMKRSEVEHECRLMRDVLYHIKDLPTSRPHIR